MCNATINVLLFLGTYAAPSAVTFDQTSLVGVVVTVIVVVAILLATLAIFVVRHKRLQTSFLNFASSHYSTQSGSATFQQSMGMFIRTCPLIILDGKCLNIK